VAEVSTLRINNGKKEDRKDIVTEEVPLTIYLNDVELLTLLCSPRDLKVLSLGFLYTSGLVQSIVDVDNVTIDKKNWISYVKLKKDQTKTDLIFKRLHTSGCGKGAIFYSAIDAAHKKIKSDLKISSRIILALMDSFQKSSVVFKDTGGVHSAGLSDGKDIVILKEDIGRHNALDKVIGEVLLSHQRCEDMLVLTSGRVSSEIILKVKKIGLPVIVSPSAPTDQAIKLAQNCNMTLVGFARGKRMNVYTYRERIITDE